MFTWIYDLPNWVLFVLMAGTALAVTWAAIFLLRPVMARLFGNGDAAQRNDLLQLILTGTGLFYGLLLGLIAAATYTTYADADRIAGSEANTVAALYRDVTGYPEPLRGQLRGDLEVYTDYVITQEWPVQQRGEVPQGGIAHATRILGRLTGFEPVTPGQEILHAETFAQFNKFIDVRRQRLNAVSSALPTPLWFVLAFGALINLVLMSMLAVDRIAAHLVVSGLFAIFVAMMIFLIAAMDNPFLGQFSVQPTALELLKANLLGR